MLFNNNNSDILGKADTYVINHSKVEFLNCKFESVSLTVFQISNYSTIYFQDSLFTKIGSICINNHSFCELYCSHWVQSKLSNFIVSNNLNVKIRDSKQFCLNGSTFKNHCSLEIIYSHISSCSEEK
jgi:hypothetical protein